ncbi:hypothetical protein ACLF3G_28620 [Falsiroseomonas sp. HC035]|uniref:hypothetical protein n=1 Tax=Falsiroseomonas sp. HC035 TaxID=3390999 RepID=UPI003D31E251
MWLFICLMFVISGWIMYAVFAMPEKNTFSQRPTAWNGRATEDAAARRPQRAAGRHGGGDGGVCVGGDGGGGGCG